MLTDDEHRDAMQRMREAANELVDTAAKWRGPGGDSAEVGRLTAKATGVLLALDYLRAYPMEDDR